MAMLHAILMLDFVCTFWQQGLVKDGNHLGGSGGGSSKQIRMASKCGPMHPLGCGLNQGQGQGQGSYGTRYSSGFTLTLKWLLMFLLLIDKRVAELSKFVNFNMLKYASCIVMQW